MGASISKYVFRVRDATYMDDNGSMLFINRKFGERGGTTGKAKIIWLRTCKDMDIPAVMLRCEARPPKYTIVLSHGNMEDLGIATSDASALVEELQCDIFIYEYTGFGIAKGKPSEANCYADALAAYNYVTHDAGVDPDKVVLFGRSMGSGPTVFIASTKRVGGVVLVAPFLSCARVVQNFKVTPPFDLFPNIDRIGRVACEVQVIHGAEDQIVPHEHGLELAQKAQLTAEPLIVQGAGHNNVEKDFQSEVTGKIKSFLDNLTALPPSTCTEIVDDDTLVNRAASRLMGLGESLRSPPKTALSGREKSFERLPMERTPPLEDTFYGMEKPADTSSKRGRSLDSAGSPRVQFADTVAREQTNGEWRQRVRQSRYSLTADRRLVPTLNRSSVMLDLSEDSDQILGSGETDPIEKANDPNLPAATVQKLKVMRTCLTDHENESFDNRQLLRFLYARKYSVPAALDLLYSCERFGDQLGIDLRGDIPLIRVRRTLSRGIFFMTGATDSKGAPVLFMRVENYKPKDITSPELIYTFMYFLDIISQHEELVKKGLCIVADMKNFRNSNFSLDSTKNFFHFLQRCFPVQIHQFLAVDSPKMVLKHWFVVKPLMRKELAKVMIPRMTRKALHAEIDRDLLPDFLGGKINCADSLAALTHAQRIFAGNGS